MQAYTIGTSALLAGARALDVIGQNVANATTPGYHRQTPVPVTRALGDNLPGGVGIDRIQRYEVPTLTRAVIQARSEQSFYTSGLNISRQAESLFAADQGFINERLETFFNQAEQLTTRTDDGPSKRVVVDAAASLAGRVSGLHGELTRLRDSVRQDAVTVVNDINATAAKIADLNRRIAAAEGRGEQALELRDQRIQEVERLGQMIDVRITEQDRGVINIMGGNAPLVVGDLATKIEVVINTSGDMNIVQQGFTTPLPVRGGSLGAFVQEYNVGIPTYMNRLDSFAQALISQVNAVQSTGLGTSGPFTFLAGSNSVTNPTIPLATAGLKMPAQNGTLAISITDTTTGVRTLTEVPINPATMSLSNVATAITAATGGLLNASVDLATNTLQFQAATGYKFDFAGQPSTSPTTVAMSGTSVPTVTGVFTGSPNQTYTFNVVGSGTIGVTPGMTLNVYDGNSALVRTFNIGEGYTPGSPLDAGNGITVRLSAGTSNNGTFTSRLISDADTGNLLPALGIGGLFTGDSAATIGVRSELRANPDLLATSRSGLAGDSSNMIRMAGLRDQKVLDNNSQRFQEYLSDTSAVVGNAVLNQSSQAQAMKNLATNLSSQQQGIVGVDINEEMVNLLQYQRMMQAASRYLSVVNTAMDAIIDMVR